MIIPGSLPLKYKSKEGEIFVLCMAISPASKVKDYWTHRKYLVNVK